MRIETRLLSQEHVVYVGKNADEFRQYDTISAHFYYFLTQIKGLLPDTARGIVDEFETDLKSR